MGNMHKDATRESSNKSRRFAGNPLKAMTADLLVLVIPPLEALVHFFRGPIGCHTPVELMKGSFAKRDHQVCVGQSHCTGERVEVQQPTARQVETLLETVELRPHFAPKKECVRFRDWEKPPFNGGLRRGSQFRITDSRPAAS